MFLNFLAQVLAKIDLFKAVVVLRSKKKSKIRTRSLGIFTLLLALLFAYFFVERIQKIIKFDLSQINSKQYLSRSQNRSYAQDVMFAVSLPSVARRLANNNSEIRKYFQFNAYVLYNDDTINGFANWTKISMVPCTASHWRAINEQFMQKIKINQYFCLPQNLTLITAEYEKNFLKVEIEKCTSSQICYNMSDIDALLSDLIKQQQKITVSIGFKNPFPNANKAQLIHEIRQFQFYAGFDLRPNIFLQFRQLRIISDYSFWLVYQFDQIIRDIEFQYLIQSFQTPTTLLQPNKIIKFSLALTNNEQIIQRNVTKVDEALSYAGFLFGVTIFGLIFLLRSFNQYRYELHVGQNSFNYDQSGYKVKENQFNIFQYLKYRVYYFISLITGIFVDWSQCFEIGRTLEEGRKSLDVQYMFRRLGLMQRFVENLYDSNYLDVMTLMRPQTIQTIKNRRLILSYYQKVITQNFDVLTVDDLFFFSSNKQIQLEPQQRNFKISKVDLLYRSKKLIRQQEGNEVSSIKFDEENDHKAQFQQSIVDGLKNALSLRNLPFICDKIAKYPLIAKNAEEVILSQQQQHVQQQLTQSFINLSLAHKKTLIKKIPLKIIHRLRLKAQQKVNQPTVQILCQKVLAKQKIKNPKQDDKYLSVNKIKKETGTTKLKSEALHILIPVQLKNQHKRKKKICFDHKVSSRNSIRKVVISDQVVPA